MKLRTLFIASLIAAVPLAPAIAQDKAGAYARREAGSVFAKFDAAYNKHDAAAIAALYEPNATFVPALPSPTLGAVITGPRNIEKFFSGAFNRFTTESLNVVTAGLVGANVVWAVGELHLTGHGHDGAIEIKGHVGTVLVKRGNRWRIQMTMANGKPIGEVTPAGATSH